MMFSTTQTIWNVIALLLLVSRAWAFTVVDSSSYTRRADLSFPPFSLDRWRSRTIVSSSRKNNISSLRLQATTLSSDKTTDTINDNQQQNTKLPNIVLVVGFESFNRQLYYEAAKNHNVALKVFADTDIRNSNASSSDSLEATINPIFAQAIRDADGVVISLLFDYDDVACVQHLLQECQSTLKTRLIFESATELMTFNQVGTFNMASAKGPPPAVQAVLSKFGSNKEEDKLQGYLKLLKVGPDLLQYVPGTSDLRTWLLAYRYWNQGGPSNVGAMLMLLAGECQKGQKGGNIDSMALPALEVTPDMGLVHPAYCSSQDGAQSRFFVSPAAYLKWRLSPAARTAAESHHLPLAPNDAPRVAVLLYRKHVITQQRYIMDLLSIMEAEGILPVPIFINGVEGHTIVRDWLTSRYKAVFESTFQRDQAVAIDAIVNTIGFPLVGGPAGSMQAGRNVDVAEQLLRDINVPYTVASPLLLQSIPMWKQSGVLGLQSVVLYSLPELDGAIDTVVLGGLVGDKIALVPERVRKLTARIKAWIRLRHTAKKDRRIAISLYGFPPNVGAVGTAALLDVPSSLETILQRLHQEGYNVGEFATDEHACGESLVAALATLCENPVVTGGAERSAEALTNKMERARQGDTSVPVTLSLPRGGLGDATVRAMDVTDSDLEEMLGKYMFRKVRRAWSTKDRGPGVSGEGNCVVSGLQVGNVFVFVQPLLGVEGDPMRLLFERDLTPHPQYCAVYKKLHQPEDAGGIGSQALIHLGMHGTVEWLPGQPLGNDRKSWSDELLGDMPNLYIYAANNPSESILAKRRGYGTLISHNVPPYGRAGLYLELANLKELVDDYREISAKGDDDKTLLGTIIGLAERSGMTSDVPLPVSSEDDEDISEGLSNNMTSSMASAWVNSLHDYLLIVQDRLFSSGLHSFGSAPSDEALDSYLEAYFGERLTEGERQKVISDFRSAETFREDEHISLLEKLLSFLGLHDNSDHGKNGERSTGEHTAMEEGLSIVSLLERSSEEVDSIIQGLDGGYIPPAPGGDFLRDGPSVLPTGRNIHALDPYRMPSPSAWSRGKRAAEEIIRQHQSSNDGAFPETVAVTLWGLDSIKTRGESVAIVLALVGAEPVKEGTGRIVRYDLVSLEKLGRPRIDVLASLSGIFRDSFANIVDLLDDMFERAGQLDEPTEMNFIRKHVLELEQSGQTERASARLFSNPPGDYGSMVNEVVGSGDWEDSESLGEIWKGRNSFSYGRNEGSAGSSGTARPEVLEKLLATTERIVQEVDSVEYGITDIQEYYANTGALKKAAENRKEHDPVSGKKKVVSVSVIEAFGGANDESGSVPVRDVEDVLRLEYRSKLLNPKWRDAMLTQGSGGAYEISQRMTAVIGWSATAQVDNFVFDQAAERYALDEEVAKQLQRSNPEAFKNVVRRLLEAAGRGMWETDEETLDRLRDLYSDADDIIEQGTG